MSLLKQLSLVLLLTGYFLPAYAAVADLESGYCAVYSADDSDKKDEKGEGSGEEEEEPDCE